MLITHQHVAILVLLGCTTGVCADVPPEVVVLEKTMHRLIDQCEPSIACVLVSRSKKYATFEDRPTPTIPGKLGAFDPSRLMRFTDDVEREAIKRLDLANVDHVPEAYGSGVVIDASGLVLTPYHVVERATKIYVRLPKKGGSYADILAADGRADLAVLKLLNPPTGLKPLLFGDGGAVRKGDFFVSFVNPFVAGGVEHTPSASLGNVKNLRQQVAGSTDEIKRIKPLSQHSTLLLTDTKLNFGCSGGAIVNLKGELVGLTTALPATPGSDTAGGFAIPMDGNYKRIIDVLKRGEEVEYGFLGVSVSQEDRGDGRGAIVRDVAPGTPASKAGMRANDIVVKINGNVVRNNEDLFLHIGAGLAGNEAEIEIREAFTGNVKTLKAKLVKSTHSEVSIASQRPKPVHGLRVDYLNTQSGLRFLEGVVVKEVEPNTPAEKKLKVLLDKAQLLVIAVNGKPVTTPAEFYREAGTGAVRIDIVEIGSDSNTRTRVTLP